MTPHQSSRREQAPVRTPAQAQLPQLWGLFYPALGNCRVLRCLHLVFALALFKVFGLLSLWYYPSNSSVPKRSRSLTSPGLPGSCLLTIHWMMQAGSPGSTSAHDVSYFFVSVLKMKTSTQNHKSKNWPMTQLSNSWLYFQHTAEVPACPYLLPHW